MNNPALRRVAIVAGVRTPFTKAGSTLKSLSAIDLGRHCVAELLQRTDLDTRAVDAVIFGTVVPSVLAPNIAREEQDQFALRSHRLAHAGTIDGRLKAEIAPVWVPPNYSTSVTTDNGIREDTSIERLRELSPVFDRRYGTVTAGNSSPLTDGAAAVLLMSEDRARDLGYEPLGFIRSYAYAALDPGEQLLMAPVLAAPVALQRAGLTLGDMDLVEMHEAFAAQVLSNLRGFESREWAERAGFDAPVGEVDFSKLNVMGGSIAIGHPFGATGARITTTLLHELIRRDGEFGLMTVCAAGGMGFAMVVQR
jgi:acetyl-CoA acyltransferase